MGVLRLVPEISTRKNSNDIVIAIESLVVRLILKAMSTLMKSPGRNLSNGEPKRREEIRNSAVKANCPDQRRKHCVSRRVLQGVAQEVTQALFMCVERGY